MTHLFNVLNGGNGLPLGIPGADGEPTPLSGHVLPHDLDQAVFCPDGGTERALPSVQMD